MFGILCAKAAGFLRDVVFASYFGTGVESDIYLQIFGIASLIFTAVGSALSTLIIKNINKAKYSRGDGQERYAAYFIRNISFMIVLITAALYLFAKPLVGVLLPGLDSMESALALRIMYIMLPSFLFISVAYMMSGLLQNRRVFFTPSIMSLPYNVIVIFVLFLGVKDIEIISMITTFGWFLHIVILLPDFYRKGYGFFIKSGNIERGSELQNTLETMYIFISGLMFQLCFLVDKMCVGVEEGMVATLSYASNLFITFSGVFVVAMSSVVFPAISQNFEHGEMDYVRELIRYIIKLMMSIFAFYLVVVVFFGEDVIRLIYERGAFTPEATKKVAQAFVIYSFGIFGYLAQNILNKLFYIAGKYKLTVTGAVVTVLLKILIDIFLAPVFGATFAAATTTLLLTLYAVFVAWQLKKIIGSYITRELMVTIGKTLLSAAVCVGVMLLTRPLSAYIAVPDAFRFVFPVGSGFAAYAVMMYFTGVVKELMATPLSKNR